MSMNEDIDNIRTILEMIMMVRMMMMMRTMMMMIMD